MDARRPLWLFGAAIAAIVAVVALARSGERPASSPVDAALASLRTELQNETTERLRLGEEVSRLRAEIAALAASRVEAGTPAAPVAAGPDRTSGDEPARDVPAEIRAEAGHSDGRPPAFDEAALIRGGFRADEAARLRELAESAEMDGLYLRDRATREGWLATPRFGEELRAINERVENLRNDLGEDGFDWFLFASGRRNRVLVSDVLDRSPAAGAGLAAGDVVLRYAGVRVFEPSELARATSEGRAGETVAVEISRDGDRRTVYVPRGPLGIRLGTDRRPPETRR